MKHIFIAVISGILLSGCVSPELGESFQPDKLDASADMATLVIYGDSEIDKGLYFQIRVNGRNKGKVFPGTFITRQVYAGEISISAWEVYDGSNGFGSGALPDSFERNPFMMGGIRVKEKFFVEGGSVSYFRVRIERMEIFVECGETRDTVTMCSRIRDPLYLESVDRQEAETVLPAYRKSL